MSRAVTPTVDTERPVLIFQDAMNDLCELAAAEVAWYIRTHETLKTSSPPSGKETLEVREVRLCEAWGQMAMARASLDAAMRLIDDVVPPLSQFEVFAVPADRAYASRTTELRVVKNGGAA